MIWFTSAHGVSVLEAPNRGSDRWCLDGQSIDRMGRPFPGFRSLSIRLTQDQLLQEGPPKFGAVLYARMPVGDAIRKLARPKARNADALREA